MCLAVPVQIKKLCSDREAIVEISGITKRISLALIDDAAVGDYVILHVGFALKKIDPEEARKTLRLFADALPEALS